MNLDEQPICKKHGKKLTRKIALQAIKYAVTCEECKTLIAEARKKQ